MKQVLKMVKSVACAQEKLNHVRWPAMEFLKPILKIVEPRFRNYEELVSLWVSSDFLFVQVESTEDGGDTYQIPLSVLNAKDPLSEATRYIDSKQTEATLLQRKQLQAKISELEAALRKLQ